MLPLARLEGEQISGTIYVYLFISASLKEKPMKDVLIMLAIVGGWFLLQAYILPKLGVST